MRRAAGSTLLLADMTRALAAVLKTHRHVFCLPHWQAITAPASREVTLTLLPAHQQDIAQLLTAAQAHADWLDRKSRSAGAQVETAAVQTDPCSAVLTALASYPG